jgi:hypothetical protein
MRGSIGTANSRREISPSGFTIGRDSRGRWTALGAGGRCGGIFRSKDAAIRYARSEAGRSPGAVCLTSAPLDLPFDKGRIGQGEGLPAWWRLGPGTRGMASFADRVPIAAGLDRRWLVIDLGIVAGLAALCLSVAVLLS